MSAPLDDSSTSFPYTIEIASPEPTIDISDCSTIICCSDCMDIGMDRVIDGDTFKSANARIRLFGVDTPERGEKCFTEATERFKELAGDTVRVEFGPRHEDNYGRILFYVYTNAGESIDEILVREGLAEAWTRDGQHRDVLVAAEKGARRDGFGCLWSN
ncbi:MAG: thermonuclease family protein [Chloroflexi bacterium]|nr:thermonuclease family protein [Chloroflexota bacterium]MDA1220295.1 thermonuclease family protein [Chloroflexota bacterium]